MDCISFCFIWSTIFLATVLNSMQSKTIDLYSAYWGKNRGGYTVVQPIASWKKWKQTKVAWMGSKKSPWHFLKTWFGLMKQVYSWIGTNDIVVEKKKRGHVLNLTPNIQQKYMFGLVSAKKSHRYMHFWRQGECPIVLSNPEANPVTISSGKVSHSKFTLVDARQWSQALFMIGSVFLWWSWHQLVACSTRVTRSQSYWECLAWIKRPSTWSGEAKEQARID